MAGPPRAHSGVKKDPITLSRASCRSAVGGLLSPVLSQSVSQLGLSRGRIRSRATERHRAPCPVCAKVGRCCCSGTPTQVKSGIWPHHPHMRCSSSSWLGARSPLREVVRDVPPCPLPISNQGYSYKPHTWGTDPTLSHLPHAYHTRPCVTILTMCVFSPRTTHNAPRLKYPLVF